MFCFEVGNYKKYIDELTAIFDASNEIIYLCNNFDITRIHNLFINIIETYNYYEDGKNKISDTVHLSEEISESLEYQKMKEYIDNNFKKIQDKWKDCLLSKLDSLKTNLNNINLSDDKDDELIKDNFKSQYKTIRINLEDIERELDKIKTITEDSINSIKGDDIQFDIYPITKNSMIFKSYFYSWSKKIFKNLQIINSDESEVDDVELEKNKENFFKLYKNLIKKFNKDTITTQESEIKVIIVALKEQKEEFKKIYDSFIKTGGDGKGVDEGDVDGEDGNGEGKEGKGNKGDGSKDGEDEGEGDEGGKGKGKGDKGDVRKKIEDEGEGSGKVKILEERAESLKKEAERLNKEADRLKEVASAAKLKEGADEEQQLKNAEEALVAAKAAHDAASKARDAKKKADDAVLAAAAAAEEEAKKKAEEAEDAKKKAEEAKKKEDEAKKKEDEEAEDAKKKAEEAAAEAAEEKKKKEEAEEKKKKEEGALAAAGVPGAAPVAPGAAPVDEKVFNFEYNNNSCYVNSALQMLIDNDDLCDKIIKAAEEKNFNDTFDGVKNSNEYLLYLLNKIIKYHRESRHFIGEAKKPSYNEYILPLREYLNLVNENQFNISGFGDPSDLFEFILDKLDILNINKEYDTTKLITLQNDDEESFDKIIYYQEPAITTNKENLIFKIGRSRNKRIQNTEEYLRDENNVPISEIVKKSITMSPKLILGEDTKKSTYILKGFIHFIPPGHYIYYKSLNNTKNEWVILDDFDTHTAPNNDKENKVISAPLGINGNKILQTAIDTTGSTLFYYKKDVNALSAPPARVDALSPDEKDVGATNDASLAKQPQPAADTPVSIIKTGDEPKFVFEDLGKKNYSQNNTDIKKYKKDLLKEYIETDGKGKHFILLVGKPGAWKSYFVKNKLKETIGLERSNFINLNPDDLRYYNTDFINEISGYLKDSSNNGVHYTVNGIDILCYPNKNGDIVANMNATLNTINHIRNSMQKNILPYFLNENKNIIYDSACDNHHYCGSLLLMFLNKGYKVSMICIDTDDETAFKRAKERQEKDGRFMTDEYLRNTYLNFKDIEIVKNSIITESTIVENKFYKIIVDSSQKAANATEPSLKYTFDTRARTPIYEQDAANATQYYKQAKFVSSLNAGHESLYVGGRSTINGAFNEFFSNKPNTDDNILLKEYVMMHISCYMNKYNVKKDDKLRIDDNLNDTLITVMDEVEKKYTKPTPDAKNQYTEIYKFEKFEELFPNNKFIKEMYLYISEERLDKFKFSRTHIYPGDVFIDILKKPPYGVNNNPHPAMNIAVNKAMIYCTGPENLSESLPTKHTPEDFLEAIKIVSKNIANAICNYNQLKNIEKIDYARICLISGGSFKGKNVSSEDVAKNIIEGITEVNRARGVKDIEYNFADFSGYFQTAFDNLKKTNSTLASAELTIPT
jgi:hypothetical protein